MSRSAALVAAAFGLVLLSPDLGVAQNVAAQAPPPPPLSPADGQAIERAVEAAPEFPAPDLRGAPAALTSRSPAARAAADAALSKAIVTLAGEEHGLIDDPASVDPDWALRADYDPQAEFDNARAEGRVGDWAASLPRRDPGYLGLVAAWKRYDAFHARGGWKPLPADLTLANGAKSKAVARLRERLAAEGYGDPNQAGDAFDAALADAVTDFQTRHGLKLTGTLDKETVEAMNVPVEARLASLSANLERARWLPDTLPPDRIVADIAAAYVTLFEDDKPALSMRAIVGDTKHKTPLFASHVSNIVFNPAWHVPKDIAKAELYPKEARSHGYLARHGFSVENGELVQHAGAKSSLGYIKFDMPNPFSVYLHDTPGRNLFTVDARGRSHGCVRLQKPKDLAIALLGSQGWDEPKLEDTIAKGDTKWTKPEKTVAVFLVYRTAQAPDDGPAIFRPDLYGWDEKLIAALDAPR